MGPSEQRSKDLQDEARRQQQADEHIRELEQEVERLREALTKHRSHARTHGVDILRVAAEQVSSTALRYDLLAIADDVEDALDGGGGADDA